jgi:hypothetical protein
MRDQFNQTETLRLPASRQECRDRLVALQGEIASIRIQIATTDIRRQADKKGLDPAWFHRAKTALRLKQQEMAELTAHIAVLNQGGQRDRFKDTLIEVLRSECTDERWAGLVSQAKQLHEAQGKQHG